MKGNGRCEERGQIFNGDSMGARSRALTVIAEGPPVGGHGAVAGEALPQLQTHSLMVARVLRTRGAGTCTRSRAQR